MNLFRGQKVKITRPINVATDNAPYAGRSITIFLKSACLFLGLPSFRPSGLNYVEFLDLIIHICSVHNIFTYSVIVYGKV